MEAARSGGMSEADREGAGISTGYMFFLHTEYLSINICLCSVFLPLKIRRSSLNLCLVLMQSSKYNDNSFRKLLVFEVDPLKGRFFGT